MRLYAKYDTVAEWCVNDAITRAKSCVKKTIKPSPFILSANIINTMFCGPETRISVSIKTTSLIDTDDITVFFVI